MPSISPSEVLHAEPGKKIQFTFYDDKGKKATPGFWTSSFEPWKGRHIDESGLYVIPDAVCDGYPTKLKGSTTEQVLAWDKPFGTGGTLLARATVRIDCRYFPASLY